VDVGLACVDIRPSQRWAYLLQYSLHTAELYVYYVLYDYDTNVCKVFIFVFNITACTVTSYFPFLKCSVFSSNFCYFVLCRTCQLHSQWFVVYDNTSCELTHFVLKHGIGQK